MTDAKAQSTHEGYIDEPGLVPLGDKFPSLQ